MELMTLAEFQTMMEKQHTNVYSAKMAKIKLKEKYQNEIHFVSRCGKSDILLLGNFVVKSKLPPRNGPSLEAVEPHP